MMQSEQLQPSAKLPSLPPCCGTGCVVCVLDYPELFAEASEQQSGDDWQDDEAATLALLEAFERSVSEAQDEPQR